MNDIGTMTLFSSVVAPAFFDTLGLASLGAPLVAVLAEMRGQATKKAFLDKFGQHLASMGLQFFGLCVLVWLAGAGLAWLRFPEALAKAHGPGSPLFVLYGILAAAGLMQLSYRLAWGMKKTAHMALGIASATCSIAAGIMITASLRGFTPLLSLSEAASSLPALLLPGNAAYYAFQGLYLTLALAYAGCAGLLFLLLRRNRDNFGRDYYAFSMRMAARVAGIAGMTALILEATGLMALEPAMRTLVTTSESGLLWIASAVLLLVCSGLWLAVARSGAPLRLKGLMVGSGVLVWLSHSLLLTVSVNLFFS